MKNGAIELPNSSVHLRVAPVVWLALEHDVVADISFHHATKVACAKHRVIPIGHQLAARVILRNCTSPCSGLLKSYQSHRISNRFNTASRLVSSRDGFFPTPPSD